MLEVLVSMLVIMFGALGIAGMQLLAITSTENARYQNVATMLGATLTANMQSNVTYWGTPPPLISVTGESSTGGPSAFEGDCTGLASVCTAPEVAGYDLREWGKEVARLLPEGTASITCPAGNTPAICMVRLTWKERNVSLRDTEAVEEDVDGGAGGPPDGAGGGGSGVGGGGAGGPGGGGGGGVGGSGSGGNGTGTGADEDEDDEAGNFMQSGSRKNNSYQTVVSIL